MIQLKDAEPLRLLRLAGVRGCYAIKLTDNCMVEINTDLLYGKNRAYIRNTEFYSGCLCHYQKQLPVKLAKRDTEVYMLMYSFNTFPFLNISYSVFDDVY